MLQYVPDIAKAVQGLGVIVQTENGLFRLALRHWPITALVLTAWGTQLYRRYQKHELTIYTGMIDSGAILGPALSLMLLAKLATDAEQERSISPPLPGQP